MDFMTDCRHSLCHRQGADQALQRPRYPISAWALYTHGSLYDTVKIAEDTIKGIKASVRVDTSHVAVVHPGVRFYRADLQGVCDSLRFTERDSTLRMFINPVVWARNVRFSAM